jgi:hypothetical protein
MQTPLLLRHTEAALTAPAHALEKRGAIYTKPWIVELLLDMAGYDVATDLAGRFAVEPAAGKGAFLVPMALRLLHSARLKGRGSLECKDSLLAYDWTVRARPSRALQSPKHSSGKGFQRSKPRRSLQAG